MYNYYLFQVTRKNNALAKKKRAWVQFTCASNTTQRHNNVRRKSQYVKAILSLPQKQGQPPVLEPRGFSVSTAAPSG